MLVARMEPTGPAFGRPDDKLRVIRDRPVNMAMHLSIATAIPGLRFAPSGLRPHTGTNPVNTTSPSTTHYPAATVKETIESHTLAVIVDNEPGVLARVIGLFSGRGYNIESLTVSETEHEKHLSRITIATRGTPMVIEQIKNQLDRMVPVHRV